jgi:hypothetical protein
MASNASATGAYGVSKGGNVSTIAHAGNGGDPAQSGTDEVHVATKSVAEGETILKGKIKAKDGEKAGTNEKKLGGDLLDHIDPLDKGASQQPDTGEYLKVDDNAEDTGPTPEMTYPLLDVEPNSVTSLNTNSWDVTLLKRVKKPRINYEQLAYEAVVGNMAGHKKAYNSSAYGKLDPEVDVAFHAKPNKRQVWKIDSESIQDSLSEAPFGFRKANAQLANDFKKSMRTYVMPNSHYHGGPTMLKRGLNQYRNLAMRRQTLDPNPETVEMAVQNARDAFVLNDQVLYGNQNTKLQFKSNFNSARVIPDSTNSGHIPAPTTWFGVQGNVSADRTFGFDAQGTNPLPRNPDNIFSAGTPSGTKGAQNTSGVPVQSYSTQQPLAFAPAQPNTGAYATHRTGNQV